MGRALVRPALPNDCRGGVPADESPAAHGLHRARGRVRRAGRAPVPVRLRAGSADELAARRTAVLVRDAERRRDGDAESIGLAPEGLRLALLVAPRPYSVVLGTDCLRAAMVAREIARPSMPHRPRRYPSRAWARVFATPSMSPARSAAMANTPHTSSPEKPERSLPQLQRTGPVLSIGIRLENCSNSSRDHEFSALRTERSSFGTYATASPPELWPSARASR